MRCPECKTELIPGDLKEFETLLEHVSDPNQEEYPPRPTCVCPNRCFGEKQFFDTDGGSYGGSFSIHEKYYSALDSFDRKIAIGSYMHSLGMGFWRYRKKVNSLRIEGENDIPSFLTMISTWLKCCYLKSWFTRKRRQKLYDKIRVT